MNNITALQSLNVNYSSQEAYLKKGNTEAYTESESLSIKTPQTAVFEKNSEDNTPQVTYKPDMEKVHAMKEETEQRLVDLFRKTMSKGFLKQVGGIRGLMGIVRGKAEDANASEKSQGLPHLISRLREELENVEVGVDATEAEVNQAIEDTSRNGYWGAEQTSDRFLEFAMALSGGDPAKADMLLDAVKEGYKLAEEMWGGELPELSQNTLEMTIKKFEAWRDGVEYVPEVNEEAEMTDEASSLVVAQTVAVEE